MQGYTHFFPIAYSATDVAIYQQDVVIHRSEGTAYEETVGDLKVWHVYVGNRCKSDYGDVRFTDASGNALAYYLWPDYDSSSARFCVRLVGADSSGRLLVWYGNPTATTTSDGDATYIFYDPFDTLDTNKWDTSALQSATIVDGYLETEGKPNTWLDYNAAATAECPVPGAFHAEANLSWVGRSSDLGDLLLYLKSSGSWVYGGVRDAWASGSPVHYASIGGITFLGSVGLPSSEDVTISIIRDSDGVVTVYLNGVSRISGVWTDTITHLHLTNTRHTTYNGKTAKWDYVLIRAYSDAPPAATAFGPEQVPGTLHHVVFGSANMMVV